LIEDTCGWAGQAAGNLRGLRPRYPRTTSGPSRLGAVALLVSGVGVANTMVISVLERRAGGPAVSDRGAGHTLTDGRSGNTRST